MWIRLGISYRALRVRARLTQEQLGLRARTTRGVVSAIERGRGDEVRGADLGQVAAALGATVDVRLRWRGEGLDRLLDEAHAATVAALVGLLERLGWQVALEVTFSIWGERGSIDVLAWHEPTGTLLVVEVKSVVADIQSLLHGLDRKARLAREIGAARGWRARSVGRLVVVAESPTSRGRARRHAAILAAALPTRGREVRAWLRAPTGSMSGLIFLSNASHSGSATPIWRRQRVRSRSGAARRGQDRSMPLGTEFQGDRVPGPAQVEGTG
jgi:transcriptional regulator with XRE-family HTH domain